MSQGSVAAPFVNVGPRDPRRERRASERHSLSLPGRFMGTDRLDHTCRLDNISVDGAAITTDGMVTVGDKLIAYFLHLGGIEGSVIRRFSGGFAMSFTATQRKRDKLAQQISRLSHISDISHSDERQHPRARGDGGNLSLLLLPDGTGLQCVTLDHSPSGASIVTPIRPPVGSEVIFESKPATVVRHHEDGIAVEFVNTELTLEGPGIRYTGDLQA